MSLKSRLERSTVVLSHRQTGGVRFKYSTASSLCFVFGFLGQFNVLIGGGGEGAAATGGYGYRVLDFLCIVAIALLVFQNLNSRRIVALAIYAISLSALAAIRVVDPAFGDDPRTAILGIHYLGYSFAGLYLAIALNRPTATAAFCWGLVLGLLVTLPIFVLQDTGQDTMLVNLGLIPGYYQVLQLDVGDSLRYAGLWTHPNEAAHVAALAAPGAAWLYLIENRKLPMTLVAGALLAIFYYTQSRGGLVVGYCVLVLPLLFGRDRRIYPLRLLLVGIGILIIFEGLSQLDFVSSRFLGAGTEGNASERLNSILAGVQVIASHPFGLSISLFHSLVSSGTGGTASPHNGFIFFAAAFGWLPFLVLLAAIIINLSVRSSADTLFMLVSIGIVLSCLFEEVPLTYPFAFVISMIIGRAFLRTNIGQNLIDQGNQIRNRQTYSPLGKRAGLRAISARWD
jgi:hypothetical protein